MRVAGGVHVALCAVELAGHVELLHIVGGREVARLPGLHLGVTRLLQQHRQPTDLELGAGADDQVGVAGAHDQARLGLDLVRVLQCAGGDRHVDQVAAKLLRQCAPLGLAGEDVERSLRGQCQQRERRSEQHKKRRAVHHDGVLEGSSVAVRAVCAQAHLVLQEQLLVGDSFARAVLRELQAHA